ncbi:Fpg/Nei family DNA glycosylase [Klenkia taihuensis]|nr:DNA-formamidopyrimidine glycosylase family protein [Klenkia taihuensis]GHE09699.1 formamidopyrimidine-DNA glycosylase [Klenkia taihuensis]
MPEGHMIHVDARRFDEAMGGHVVHAESPQGRFTTGAAALDGRTLRSTEAFGKNLFLRFSGDAPQYLHVHLGLIGGWTWWDHDHQQLSGRPVVKADDSNVRLRLRSGRGDAARSAELRGAITCTLVDEEGLDKAVAKLGPDPLRDDADPDVAWAKVRKSRKPIGGLLLDQAVTAGAGLIWRAEVPFLAGVDPHRPGVDVTEDEFSTMWSEMRRVMKDAVERGGKEITTDPADRPGTDGHVSRDDAFYVFRREGEPCLRCGTAVEVAEMGNRKVWWCPSCQPR